jgi:hypothetical protein
MADFKMGKPISFTDEKGEAYGVKRTGSVPHVISTDTGGTPVNLATEATVSQLVMAVTNAINETVHDLNAAAFSEVTAITKDYELDNVEFNFTTAAPRTITITTADGTLILNEEDNTDTSFVWKPDSEMAFNGGDNLTVTVTQAGSACLMDCILKIKSGTNTLSGNPSVGWLDTDNVEQKFQNADGRPRISVVDYEHEISKGNIEGHVHFWAKGERDSVAIDTKGVDVWLGPTARIPLPLSAGEQMTVKFNDANDTAGGTGVRAIKIEYIRASDGSAQTEDIIANGGNVNTVATDIAFVNHIFATDIGSNGVAEGNIDIHEVGDDTKVYNLIALGGNMSLTCAMKVPDNQVYFITNWHGGITGNKPSKVRLRSTDWDGVLYDGDDPVFLFKDTAPVGESPFNFPLCPPIRVPGGTIIKISVWATQAGGFAGGMINGYYEAA